MLLGWPFVGMPLLVLLGLGVRDGATPLDAWVQRGHGGALHGLLVFTDPAAIGGLLVAALAAAVYRRRWLLTVLVVAVPLLALQSSETLKEVFGRVKGHALAYPSGHTTMLVVAAGMFVLALGARRWLLAPVGLFVALGMVGQGVTYHYFTDAVGALLLGSSLVAAAAAALRWSP